MSVDFLCSVSLVDSAFPILDKLTPCLNLVSVEWSTCPILVFKPWRIQREKSFALGLGIRAPSFCELGRAELGPAGLSLDTLPQTLGEYCQTVGEVRYATVYMDPAPWFEDLSSCNVRAGQAWVTERQNFRSLSGLTCFKRHVCAACVDSPSALTTYCNGGLEFSASLRVMLCFLLVV